MSNEENKASFFSTHIGQECRVVGDSIRANGDYDIKGTYRGVLGYVVVLSGWWNTSINNCKMILRSVYSITDAQAVECALMGCPDYRQWVGIREFLVRRSENAIEVSLCDDFGIVFKISPNGKMSMENCFNVKFDFDTIAPIDYLRSQGFLLPFMGIDPIEAQWTIIKQ